MRTRLLATPDVTIYLLVIWVKFIMVTLRGTWWRFFVLLESIPKGQVRVGARRIYIFFLKDVVTSGYARFIQCGGVQGDYSWNRIRTPFPTWV
jgi:hypothetical protein